MAILKLENGTLYTDLNQITQELAPLNIQINRWNIPNNSELYQFFMKLHIRSSLLFKGGTRNIIKIPLKKGDLGGSRYVQLHIKLV